MALAKYTHYLANEGPYSGQCKTTSTSNLLQSAAYPYNCYPPRTSKVSAGSPGLPSSDTVWCPDQGGLGPTGRASEQSFCFGTLATLHLPPPRRGRTGLVGTVSRSIQARHWTWSLLGPSPSGQYWTGQASGTASVSVIFLSQPPRLQETGGAPSSKARPETRRDQRCKRKQLNEVSRSSGLLLALLGMARGRVR